MFLPQKGAEKRRISIEKKSLLKKKNKHSFCENPRNLRDKKTTNFSRRLVRNKVDCSSALKIWREIYFSKVFKDLFAPIKSESKFVMVSRRT